MTAPTDPSPAAPPVDAPTVAARAAGLLPATAMVLLAACLPEGEAATGGEAEEPAMTETAPPHPGPPDPAPMRSEPLPPPRDPDVAVREEFDAAAAAGTAAAFELFVARHPGSPLAAEARDRLAALGGG